MTRYGHVPEENLGVYRYWATLARQADTLGGTLSGLGEYELANAMWRAQAILKAKARSYRVVIAAAPDTGDQVESARQWIIERQEGPEQSHDDDQ